MTRLVTCGYETGDIAEAGSSSISGTGNTVAVVNSTPTPRAGGSYCLKSNMGTAGANTACKVFSLLANLTDVWLRYGVYPHITSSLEVPIVGFYDSASAAQCCITYSSLDNLLRARQGIGTAGTLLATSSATMAQDTWQLIEVRWQASSTTSGTVEVWLNGTRVINFSGDNTATANVNVASIGIGHISAGTATAGQYIGSDDIAINNTSGSINNGRIGDGRIVLLVPNGAGSNTGLTRGGTDTGANYSQCSEVPPSMTQYVFGATAALRDTYALSDLSVTPGTINCCEVIALAQNSDAGAGSLGLTVKSGATTNEGTAQALGTSALYYRQLYETDPATSVAWTASGVNALEAGVTVR